MAGKDVKLVATAYGTDCYPRKNIETWLNIADVNEAVLFNPEPSETVIKFWEDEYPAITTVEKNIEMIQCAGFDLLGHFPLPKSSWFDHFYEPMDIEIERLMEKYQDNQTALSLLKTCRDEIDMYDNHSHEFGYEFFVCQKK